MKLSPIIKFPSGSIYLEFIESDISAILFSKISVDYIKTEEMRMTKSSIEEIAEIIIGG